MLTKMADWKFGCKCFYKNFCSVCTYIFVYAIFAFVKILKSNNLSKLNLHFLSSTYTDFSHNSNTAQNATLAPFRFCQVHIVLYNKKCIVRKIHRLLADANIFLCVPLFHKTCRSYQTTCKPFFFAQFIAPFSVFQLFGAE